ncbi:MAG: DMT family transporter [Gammaproteobacteria bacterium]|nr:DMT family transporter [Gammaproteobacteria bacterium]
MTATVAEPASRPTLAGAWLTVVLIWSTTPLAIQWSSVGAGPVFSLASRFVIGAIIFGVVLLFTGVGGLRSRDALLASLILGLNMFASMMLVYWGAQFVPSGLIAVLFGLTPIMTALWSLLILENERMTLLGVIGVLLGVAGLYLIFGSGDAVADRAWLGFAAVLGAMTLQSGTVVTLKRLSMQVGSLAMTSGGVIVAAVFCVLAWLVAGMPIPAEPTTRAIWSILYLGAMGSVMGFLLYFWMLRRVSAIQLSLITLVTPITGLLVGQWFNAERLPPTVWSGVALVIFGLGIYQFSDWQRRRLD